MNSWVHPGFFGGVRVAHPFIFWRVLCFLVLFILVLQWFHPPPRGYAGGRIGTRFLRPRGTSPLKGVNPAGTPGYRKGTESFFGLKGARRLCRMYKFTSNPSFGWDVNKTRSCVERLSPSSHVKEPSVTAHDEWSIGDLLHCLNYPSLPITFPCFESSDV